VSGGWTGADGVICSFSIAGSRTEGSANSIAAGVVFTTEAERLSCSMM
jgi:hypothetical protein